MCPWLMLLLLLLGSLFGRVLLLRSGLRCKLICSNPALISINFSCFPVIDHWPHLSQKSILPLWEQQHRPQKRGRSTSSACQILFVSFKFNNQSFSTPILPKCSACSVFFLRSFLYYWFTSRFGKKGWVLTSLSGLYVQEACYIVFIISP